MTKPNEACPELPEPDRTELEKYKAFRKARALNTQNKRGLPTVPMTHEVDKPQPATGVKLPKLQVVAHGMDGFSVDSKNWEHLNAEEAAEVIRIVEAYPALQAQLSECLSKDATVTLLKEFGQVKAQLAEALAESKGRLEVIGNLSKERIAEWTRAENALSLAERYKGALERISKRRTDIYATEIALKALSAERVEKAS